MAEEVKKTRNEYLATISDKLDLSLNAVSDALPKDFNKARFFQNTIALLKQNPDLQKYPQGEILAGSMRAAYLGLDFMTQEAWLVPYSGHVQFQMSYKGACKFVKKYSMRPMKDIYAKVVRDGDFFEHGVNNGQPFVNWKPLSFNDKEEKGVFAVALFEDGGMLYEFMTKAEVDKIRRCSKAKDASAWREHYGEMMKKTCVKRLAKGCETDFDNVEQKNAWDSDNDEFEKIGSNETVIDPFNTEEVNENAEENPQTEESSVIDTNIVKEEIIAEAQEVFK